jgi:hypothetical protein
VASRVSIGEAGGDPIVLDASVREVHSVAGEVTEHPVEKGVDIVDHYRVQPRKFEVEFVVTNSPLDSSLIPGLTLINSIVGLVQGDADPSANAWAEFQRFVDDAVVLEISSSLETYPNMVLTDLSVTRTAGTTNGLHGTLSVREVRFVETETGLAIALAAPLKALKSVGKKTNKDSNTTQARQSSGLLKTFQAVNLLQ